MANKKSKKGMLLLLALLLLFGSGCGSDQRVLERLGFLHTVAFDLLPDGMLKIAASIPRYGGEKSSEELETTARSSKDGKMRLSQKTNWILVSGQIRNTMYGTSLAKQGIKDHIDSLVRDPSISPLVKITVVNGSATDMLSKDYPKHLRTGQYFDEMLEKESLKHLAPRTTVTSFIRDLTEEGIDPIAPILRGNEEDVVFDGIALFKDDRYVAKVPAKDTMIFYILKESFKRGEIHLEMDQRPDEQQVMLEELKSKRRVVVDQTGSGQPKISLNIELTGSVREYYGNLNLDKADQKRLLEQWIAECVTKRANKMIRKLQEYQVDSLGIGRYVRNHGTYREWKKQDWHTVYPKLQIECQIKVKIKDYGKFVG